MNLLVDDARQVMALLRSKAQHVEQLAPGATWYIFGSALRALDNAADIDVLVVSDTHESIAVVRRELQSLCAFVPLHLLLFTTKEESELNFVVAQRCVQVFPLNEANIS